MVQSQLSPMMQHYMETKKQYPDCVLFYRLGDFYEMFFDDALTVSKELEITLTGKECGLPERAPMCGVPFHAVDSYLNHLVQKGYKVAIAEQMEDPKQAKGLVKREVIRVVTPGTITSAQALDETKNNYLMGIVCTDGGYGVSTADISTGDFLVTEVSTDRELFDEINKFSPSEIICNNAFYVSGVDIEELKNRYHVAVSALDSHFFGEESCHKVLQEHFRVGSLSGLGLEDYGTGIIAAGAVMQYHVRDPEEHPGAHHHHQALFHRPVHDHRHLHQAEPGAGGDHAGEAEAGDPAVGSGQDQDRHGRPPAESLHRTAPDPPRGDHRPPERGGGAEHELHFQGGDPGVFKPRLRSGAPDRAHQLQDRQSQGPDLLLQFPGDAALHQTPFGRIFQSAVKSSGR